MGAEATGCIAKEAAGALAGALALVLSAGAAAAAETQLCQAQRQGEGWDAVAIAELYDGRVVSDNLMVTYRAPFADLTEGDSILVERQTGAAAIGELRVHYIGTPETRRGHVSIVVPAFIDGVAAMLAGLGGEDVEPLRHVLRWTVDGKVLFENEGEPAVPNTWGQVGSALHAVVLRWDDTATAGAPTPARAAIDSFVLSESSAVDVFVDQGGERVHAGVLRIPKALMREADAGARNAMSEQMAMIREGRCATL